MDFFVKHWKVNRSGTLMMLAFQLGLFLMGVVMVLGINAFLNDDRDYAAVGGMMALMATVMGGLARGSGTGWRSPWATPGGPICWWTRS